MHLPYDLMNLQTKWELWGLLLQVNMFVENSQHFA